MRRYIIIIIFSLIVNLASALFAVEIEPSRIEVSAPSGKSSVTLIKVTNWQDYPTKISAKPDYYRQILTDNSIPPGGKEGLLSCQNWLKLEPNEFKLSPKTSMYIECTINVPKGAREEHLASILFDEEGMTTTYKKKPSETGNITLEIIPRFTIPIYVTITGTETIAAEISNIKVIEGPTIGTIKTEITLHNKGTVHLRPSGTLLIMDSKKNIVETLSIGECLPVFPDYKEKIPVYYPEMLEPGIYTAICTINIGDGRLVQKKTSFRITEDYEVQ